MAKTAKPAPAPKRRSRVFSTARLDQLIEEAIVDAYGDSEQTSGFYTMLLGGKDLNPDHVVQRRKP